MIEFIGWLGAVAFAICGVPQAIKSVRTMRADDLSWAFLLLWLIGELAMIIYVLGTSVDLILLFNYFANLGCLLTILYVKVRQL